MIQMLFQTARQETGAGFSSRYSRLEFLRNLVDELWSNDQNIAMGCCTNPLHLSRRLRRGYFVAALEKGLIIPRCGRRPRRRRSLPQEACG